MDTGKSTGRPAATRAADAHRAVSGEAGEGQHRRSSAHGRIVVAVDGSPASVDALAWARGQAELTGADVDAVTCWELPIGYGIEFPLPETDWAANAQRVLDIAIEQVISAGGPTITGRVLRGPAAEALVTAATDADLLVVGSRGHGAMAGMVLGSVSEYVAAHAPCPVVVIRHRTEVDDHR